MIEIGKQPLELKDVHGSVVKYENGRLSYSSGEEGRVTEAYNELVVPVGGECHVLLDDGIGNDVKKISKLKNGLYLNRSMKDLSSLFHTTHTDE